MVCRCYSLTDISDVLWKAVSFMYIAAASPNRASMGATNGFAQVVVSVMRAVGPAVANSAFSISIERQYLGGNMVYCVMAGMVWVAMGAGILLPRAVRNNYVA
jgi:hypothetical protein